jgi:hypothetical protein
MKHDKKHLIHIAKKFGKQLPLSPSEVDAILAFKIQEKEISLIIHLKDWAVPLSLTFGFILATFAGWFDPLIESLPAWTNLSPQMLSGVDYLWSILGDPIEKPNMVYHVPNIVLYSFGIVGVKHLLDRLERHTWLDKVLEAQLLLRDQVKAGQLNWQLADGHSLLFVGTGDFIAQQFADNHQDDCAVTISDMKPRYTNVWNQYDSSCVFDDLKMVIERSGGANAGEYVFFPVKDLNIFLPGEKDFDLSPHKLDIFCQNIRLIEQHESWPVRPILIVGDIHHSSFVQSENQKTVIPKSQDTISLLSISQKYEAVRLLDPTDIVLKKIIAIARGRQIVFRATKEGISEYKARFYKRLKLLKYKSTKQTTLTIGYDLFEDQTEQQTLARKIQDYYPVVLSKNVSDALLRNGYQKDQFLYVPDLVLEAVSVAAAKQ